MSTRMEMLRQELEDAHRYLDSVLDRVGDRWNTQVYSEGAQWNVHELLIHLSIADQGLTNQAMGIAEGREVIPADFDLERYNRRSVEKRAGLTVQEARIALNNARSALLGWLMNADDSVLDKTGRHASLAIMSVEEIIRTAAAHDRNHASDIARVLNLDV